MLQFEAVSIISGKRRKLINLPKRSKQLFSITSDVIAVDVDGTLLLKSGLNESLVEWCKQQKLDGKKINALVSQRRKLRSKYS